MKFKEGVAYIVTKDTIRAFVEDVDKTDLRMYDDIKEVKDEFAEWINFLDYVILFIEEQQVWYDTSLCDEYTVSELTPELLYIELSLTEKVIYRSKKVII